MNVINKWGNSLGVRIPQEVAKEIGLKVGSVVEVTVIDGNVVILPIVRKDTLADLLEGVTPDLIGGEVDWGHPIGAEVW
jgi:antitoxin MazE